ncbi:hypothetical protein RclHR1_00470027 [Rhizophagus clarus]|uniref:F-box domain-containing protein n=1 Tax=Rhizophagus clarus TaxID=94130 RepID=A0A2Z6SCD8_9GLOM|nr:hypothetical protein RclHR1_00470027 [Rhizophagus clarus]GES91959.1 hypothetical protein GLOIN_2v1784405 [Rhizophagus clarus]
MPHQLSTDCLDEILEHLENDKTILHSCLLVNRLWCKISVRILWRNIWRFKYIVYREQHPLEVASSILSTLVACLPNESKELLYKNKIFIPTPTSKPPLFNYVTFCKVLSICEIIKLVENVLRNEPSNINSSLSLKDKNSLVTNEVFKMFTNQIPSLKKLTYDYNQFIPKFSFTYFPGARDLLELRCSSDIPAEFFYQLSQICNNLQIIFIEFRSDDVSNELKELISLQNNLKSLTLIASVSSWANFIPALTKLSNTINTITKLHLYGNNYNLPLSFVSLFTNLEEIIFSFDYGADFGDFKILQFANFPNLQILKFPQRYPKPEYLMKFLEINGKNLKTFYTYGSDNSLSSSIADFCPNLKNLFIGINHGEINTLKTIFNSCQYLESIKIWCGKSYSGEERTYLSEKEVFETVTNHSPSNFCELKIYYISNSDFVSPEDLESFFINWKNRVPKKLLRLIINKNNNIEVNEENKKIAEKYENLGIIKFSIEAFYDEDIFYLL